ncbi:MAG: hypothetical protein R2798_10140 [Chitinophagales bacterium]|nr:hypothetical protein [Bacteroidota bacterium]MCB9044076.1 hypothetical protein [Chitinophagales bacterium]
MATYSYLNLRENVSREGLLGTILVHAILLLAFFFIVMQSIPLETPDEGLLITFDQVDSGKGEALPDAAQGAMSAAKEDNPVKDNPKKENLQSSGGGKGLVDNKVQKSNNKDAPALPEANRKQQKNSKNVANENQSKNDARNESAPASSQLAKETVPEINKNALFTKRESQSTTAVNSENSLDKNMAVNASDDAEARRKTQAQNTNLDPSINNSNFGRQGVNAFVDGRRLLSIPNINDKSQYEGIINVRIKVDKAGNVISADYVSAGSTTSNSTLKTLALNAAKAAKFNSSSSATEVQTGTISFTFKVQ